MVSGSTVRPALDSQLTAADYEAVGTFIVAWNQAEMLIDTMVLWTLDVQMTTLEKIMGSPNLAPRVDIFIEVVREKVEDKELVAMAEKCRNKLLGMSGFRNAVAHGRWAFSTDLKEPASSRKATSSEMVTVRKIKQKYVELCELTWMLADLNSRLGQRHAALKIAMMR